MLREKECLGSRRRDRGAGRDAWVLGGMLGCCYLHV